MPSSDPGPQAFLATGVLGEWVGRVPVITTKRSLHSGRRTLLSHTYWDPVVWTEKAPLPAVTAPKILSVTVTASRPSVAHSCQHFNSPVLF